MLGSHDSYTYQRANNPLIQFIKGYWRTQTKTIDEQYKEGVRFFDIRVKRDIVNTEFGDFTYWRTCHGLAEFDEKFINIAAICRHFEYKYEDAIYRIWLEKGTKDDELLFTKHIDACKKYYHNLVQAVIKKGEVVLYCSPKYPKIHYYALNDWTLKNIIKSVFNSPIRTWAKNHNPKITQEIIDSDELYFLDYV